MIEKIKGIRTGTVDTIAHGRRLRWHPTSELVLITNGKITPTRIAANPSAKQALSDFTNKEKVNIKDAARLFIGFNVGSEKYWSAGQVYLMTYLLRAAQLSEKNDKSAPAFSTYVGFGAFPGEAKIVSERSMQVMFMNFEQRRQRFFEDMVELAQTLAEWLHQESVMIELSEEGSVVYSDYITSDPSIQYDLNYVKSVLEESKGLVDEEVWNM